MTLAANKDQFRSTSLDNIGMPSGYICELCNEMGIIHITSGMVLAYCEHRHVGLYKAPLGQWQIVFPCPNKYTLVQGTILGHEEAEQWLNSDKKESAAMN
jgi:hypothetical protein